MLITALHFLFFAGGMVVATRSSVDAYTERIQMLNWAMPFLFVALMAGLLGFTGLADAASQIGLVLFILFLSAFFGSFIFGRPPV